MFASWWSRKQNKPFPKAALPDLDRAVAAHWDRGVAPPVTPLEKPPGDSLDFGPVASYRAGLTKERSRRRRRLLASLLVGLLLGPLATVAFIFFYPLFSSWVHGTGSLGQRITFGPRDLEEIFYSNDISAEQALQLGAFLQSEGIFDGLSSKSVRLSKDGEVFVVGFVLEWNNWLNENAAADFRDLLPRLSRGAFKGSPVEIHLCARQPDSKGRPMPTMRIIRTDDEH
ncbi:MAG TPA: hypothetical protein VH682_15090 [Gemmataceae bacterium]|jgi:hypothetical protein